MKAASGFCLLLCIILGPVVALSATECTHKNEPPPLAAGITGTAGIGEPIILTSSGDTTWIQVHSSSNTCPGDPNLGHAGEATGGPDATETWCFENGPGDSCGTTPPWDARCFTHVDVRAQPSQTGINFWHVDTYRADQRAYCGGYALWCGSGALWEGQPVECGTWWSAPGYGSNWNCYVQLTLPSGFSVANGCTLLFDPRYDTECRYDYFYVDYWNGSTWTTLATFNTTSNNPGGTCNGAPTPDHFANTDTNRLTNCDWQARTNPDEPAFKGVIAPAALVITSGPKFRWRFVSDAAWDDAGGQGNTDGAAFVDNVWVCGDTARYLEDFETGVLDPALWSLPDPPGVIDQWHIVHDPDPPYEGGDGHTQIQCAVDSSYVYRARPENGYPAGTAWRNGWHYRLMTPRVPVLDTGCLVQAGEYWCSQDYTCDYTARRVRFFDSDYGRWCPWTGDPINWICGSNCYWWYDRIETDVSRYYDASADSVQFAWEVVDASSPNDICRGKHSGTDYQVDNVSIGFFDDDATRFWARAADLLHDTFFTGLCGYNSLFDVYSSDTVSHYSGGVTLPWEKQLVVSAADPDSVESVELVASDDGGATWVSAPMVLREGWWMSWGDFEGTYSGTVCPADFGLVEWEAGTGVWYYVRATDGLSNVAYFPEAADPANPAHTGARDDYLEFSILPTMPDTTSAQRILLVCADDRLCYDWAPCLSSTTTLARLGRIYEQTLDDAGYTCDRFDINCGNSYVACQPVDFSDYDAVVWFTGPVVSIHLFQGEAQRALRDYLGGGGKVVLCGDWIAWDMAPYDPPYGGEGEDSLGGDFFGGIMGSTYLGMMPSSFDYPYVYAAPVESVEVFGMPVAVDLETILVYRECPFLKDMSYVLTNASPPAGYTAQPLMYVANPTVAAADEVIYTEYQGQGQCVYVNFDLCASVNHSRGYCSGDAAGPAPDFAPGTYDGRVELMRVILEDIFGLPSSGGTAGVEPPSVPGYPGYQWALGANAPNPLLGSTEIALEVASRAQVKVRVYSVAGQLVRTLADEPMDAGRHSVSWDGRDRAGARVASGVYFYTMEAGPYKATRKMLVVK